MLIAKRATLIKISMGCYKAIKEHNYVIFSILKGFCCIITHQQSIRKSLFILFHNLLSRDIGIKLVVILDYWSVSQSKMASKSWNSLASEIHRTEKQHLFNSMHAPTLNAKAGLQSSLWQRNRSGIDFSRVGAKMANFCKLASITH